MKRILALLFFFCIANITFAQGNLKIGDKAPEILLSDISGKKLALSSLQGKLVLIDFWATWCAPCVEEQPELKALYNFNKEFVRSGKFEILGVSLDKKKESWEQSIKRFEIDWLQVSDLMFWKSPVAKAYDLQGLPYNVIVDEKGIILAVNLHGKELSDFINSHLRNSK